MVVGALLALSLSAAPAVSCPQDLNARHLYALRDLFSDKDLDKIIADPTWRALITTPGVYAHNVEPYKDGDEKAASYLLVVDGPLHLRLPLALPPPWQGEMSIKHDGRKGELWCAKAVQGFYDGRLSWLRTHTPLVDVTVTIGK